MAKEALEDYFQPIKYLFSIFNRSLSLEEEKKALQLRQNNSLSVLRVIQRAVCLNQGEYLQYTFITAEKHRKLKDAFRKDKSDLKSISFLTKELMDYINGKFYENTRENFKLLHAYYQGRKGPNPRICIKGSFKMNDKSSVVSVFRDRMVDYDSDSEIEKNHGFYSIYKNGMYFLENDIPNATAKGRYFNPRLNKECVRNYLGYDKGEKIKKWSRCWAGEGKDPSSYYKSTLIVPMTLWNNKVTDEFKDLVNMDKVDRTIFGFLCFDHADENYFDEENDVSVGYVFADIMSMYVFTRLVYMEISKTFSSVESWLGENSIDLNLEPLAALWKNIPSKLDVRDILNPKLRKTTNNDLISIDDDLLNFAKGLKNNSSNTMN